MTGKSFVDDKGKINYSEAELAQGLEWYQEMVDAKVTPTLQELRETSAAAGFGVPAKKFLSGEFAGVTEWAAAVGNSYQLLQEQNQKLIISKYPTITDGSKGYVLQSIMPFGISKNIKHPE